MKKWSDPTCPKCSRKMLEVIQWSQSALDGETIHQAKGECPFHGVMYLARSESQGWIRIPKRKVR